MSNNEMITKIRELKELQSLIDEATAEAEAIRDELKAMMTDTGVSELTVDVYKLRYTSVTSNRFDSKAFKENYSELYAQYCKPSTSMRFTVA